MKTACQLADRDFIPCSFLQPGLLKFLKQLGTVPSQVSGTQVCHFSPSMLAPFGKIAAREFCEDTGD